MSKEKKAAFTQEAHGLTGEHLRARMKAIVINETEITHTISLEGNGKFLDSPGLAEKYKNKPDQLTNVRAKANSIICPTRGVRIYEDLRYESGFKDEATHTTKRKLDLSTEDTVRPKAKAKGKAKAPALVSGTENPNQLCPKQIKKLDDWLKFLDGAGEKLSALKHGIAVIDQWIAPKTKEILDQIENNYVSQKELCETLKQDGECNDFKDFVENMVLFKQDFNAKIFLIEQQVRSATAASQPKQPPIGSGCRAKTKAKGKAR